MTDRAKVLVLENDATIAGMVKKFIEREGWDVESISTGLHVASLIKTGNYAAVLLDLMVPSPSGAEIIAAMRAEAPELLPRIILPLHPASSRCSI